MGFAERAQKATFVCESYDVTLSKAQAGSVVYCDPPYAPLSESVLRNTEPAPTKGEA